MPRVLAYLRRTCTRYDALHPLRDLLAEIHGGASQ
jgi:aminoglycoside/choline kinase family phosphotransferase